MQIINELCALLNLRQIGFWAQLGSEDIASRYRRSVLGAFWIVLVNSLTIIAIGFVYSALFGIALDTYFPFLVVGYIFWLWISSSLLEMSAALTSYRYIVINNAVTPMAVFTRIFARNLLIFAHNIPIIAFVLLLYGPSYGWGVLLVVPNFLLICLLLFTGTGILAFFAARYQDVRHLITAAIGVLFLITPVIWSPDILTERAYIASINPLTHVMELVRAPLLGDLPSLLNYSVCLALLAVCIAGFMRTYKQCNAHYIFWI